MIVMKTLPALVIRIVLVMACWFALLADIQGQPVYILHRFGDGTVTGDGTNPNAFLIQGLDGNFYGTTPHGGSTGHGTVFKITLQGSFTVLHNFFDGTVTNDGSGPTAGLIQGLDGNFYGTTNGGGTVGQGTVFKITPQGTVTILHSFGDGSVANDGSGPQAPLIQGYDGNFYGTTPYGGSSNEGTLFKITPQGVTTILHNFGNLLNDGSGPTACLIQGDDGNFYGSTNGGGSASKGTVFRVTPLGVATILHSFGDGSVANDGLLPGGLVQGTDGNFYGATYNGGSAGDGTVFKITPQGQLTILHNFGDASVASDGINPLFEAALILGIDGNFYGTTQNGGSVNNGTVFEITPQGTVTILHSFGDGSVTNDGLTPTAGLVQGSDGNFYGTTLKGGSAGQGTVFQLVTGGLPNITSTASASGSVGLTFNYQITGTNSPTTFSATTLPGGLSINPNTGLISGVPTTPGSTSVTLTLSNGAASSTFPLTISIASLPVPSVTSILTAYGSVGSSFSYTITANNNATSYSTSSLSGTGLNLDSSDGVITGTPTSPGTFSLQLTATNGTGTGNPVTLTIQIANSPQTLSQEYNLMHGFGDGSVAHDGNIPNSILQGFDGNFYGVSELGGSSNEGAIYEMTVQGSVSLFYSFSGVVTNPTSLIQASDSSFYGTTASQIFKVSPLGQLTLLHVFTNSGQLSGLIQGYDGNFYGTTPRGGATGQGTIFKITPQGALTILHNFGDGSVANDGSGPGGLVQGTDGNFYATTSSGGSANAGTVFKITLQGFVTILHSFGDGSVTNDGAGAQTPLIQAQDGNFYGTTPQGGSAGKGTAFKITTQGAVTILHNFGDGTVTNDGSGPSAALLQGYDANFYGTTSGGGSANKGTVFEMTSAGVVTIVHNFSDGSVANDGANPNTPLIQNSDGNFYGVTPQAGIVNDGTIFSIIATQPPIILPTFLGSAYAIGAVDNPLSYTPKVSVGISGSGANVVHSVHGQTTGNSIVDALVSLLPQSISKSFIQQTNWILTGTLPNYLSFNATTGTISGTPAQTGTYTVTLFPLNAAGEGTPQTVTIYIVGPPEISSPESTESTVGTPFSYQVTAFFVFNSQTFYGATFLPSWLSVDPLTGIFSGTPPTAGTYLFNVVATNVSGQAVQPVSLTVAGDSSSVPTITSPFTASGNVGGTAFSYQISASNNPTSYTALGLPPGLIFNPVNGTIIGTPRQEGNFTVPITASNAFGSVSSVITLVIGPAPAPGLPNTLSVTAVEGSFFTYQIPASGVVSNFGENGALPAGLAFNTSTGVISGTPTTTGSFPIILSAGNSSGTANSTLTLTVNNPLSQTITFPAIPNQQYPGPTVALGATASSGLPVSYGVTSGPATISGSTLTLTGTGSVTVQASQSGSASYLAATSVSQTFAVGGSGAGLTTSTSAGQVTVTGYTGSGGQLVIPSTINGFSVITIGPNAFNGSSNLTSVTIPTSVTSIGANAFNGCTSLTSITIPSSVTSIGSDAFEFCTSLTSAIFLGNAPAMGAGVFASTLNGFTVYYSNGAAGFTSPTWTDSSGDPYPAVNFGTGLAQTINFPAIANQTLGAAPFTLNATASSGLAVSYTVASGPATLSGTNNNTVTLTGSGAVVIRANQGGSGTYAPAINVTQSFTVSPASQTTWDNGGGDSSWVDPSNWSLGVPVSSSGVAIGTQPTGNFIRVNTGGPATIATLTFNNTLSAGVALLPNSGETLLVNGAITNSSAEAETFTIPVVSGASALYTGGILGLKFGQLTVNTNNVTTSGLVSVSQTLTFTINSASSYGKIGSITATSATININGSYKGAAGDSFQLTLGNFSGATLGTLPTLTVGLNWNTSNFLSKGILSVVSGQTSTFTDGGNDGAWSDTSNWSPTPASSSVVPGITTSSGQNVIIATVGTSTSADGIVVNTGNVSPSDAGVLLGSLTFNNSNPVSLSPFDTETLTVAGNITNTTAVSDTLSLPVFVGTSAPSYAGGTGGLNFNSALIVGTSAVATSGKIVVNGTLSFTINSTSAYGSIGTINASGATARIILGANYTPTAGDTFTLTTAGSFTSSTQFILPTLSGGLTWNTSNLINGVLSVTDLENQTINPFSAIGTQSYGEVPFTITPPTATSGLPVKVTVVSGPATISGDTITLTGTGTVVLAANQAGNASFTAAAQVTTSFTVGTGTTATVTLGSLTATYNGSAQSATATTVPPGLYVTFTYNGLSTPPTNAGTYTVVGIVTGSSYQGSKTGTLIISKASAAITFGNLVATYNGSAQSATATATPAVQNISFTYNGLSTPPTNDGSYMVTATIEDPNYQGTATSSFVINSTAIDEFSTPPTFVTAISAQLNWLVNVGQGVTAVVTFEYGTDGVNFSTTGTPTPLSGNNAVEVDTPLTGLSAGTTYYYRIVVSGNGFTYYSSTSSFTTLSSPMVKATGAALVVGTNNVQLNGTVNAEGSSTTVTFEYGTDDINFPYNMITASPSAANGNNNINVSATITNTSSTPLIQGTTYYYRVRGVSSGGTSVSSSAPILAFARQFPNTPVPSDYQWSLQVNLSPPGTSSFSPGWRFVGEQIWRPSGSVALGLTTGDYQIEYEPANGYNQPSNESESFTTTSETEAFISHEYYASDNGTTGSLSVVLEPEDLAEAQWRLLGTTQWYDSGVTLSGLSPGYYLVECKPVPGQTTPAPASILVNSNQNSEPELTYVVAPTPSGAQPEPLTFANVTNNLTPNLPYAFVGQIRSDVGSSTGFVVTPHVVATAGHVVFDDTTFTYTKQLQWLFERQAGTYEPTPVTPAGTLVLDGYAAEREKENTPGISALNSQNLDVAALYFFAEAGGGGYSGYLASNSITSDNYLTSSTTNKMLVGYPIEGEPTVDTGQGAQGEMFATAPISAAFTQALGTDSTTNPQTEGNPYQVYTTDALYSVGGNSGGPLCVEYIDGNYYPAAIYLGGLVPSTGSPPRSDVRAIDGTVVALFDQAETNGNTGTNNTSGGSVLTGTTLLADAFSTSSLQVNFSASSPNTAGWALSPTDPPQPGGATLNYLSPGNYTVYYLAVPGYLAPSPYSVTLSGGHGAMITAAYASGSLTPLDQWEQKYPLLTNPSPTATPENDGVPNLLKYLFDINPSSPMTASDHAALPTVEIDTTTNPQTPYLALVYRQYASETGIEVNLQTSTDLKTWTTVTPSISQQVGTDITTGDPIMEIGVIATGSKQFIRLDVTMP